MHNPDKFNFKKHPFLRITTAFIAGLLINKFTSISLINWTGALFICLLIITYFERSSITIKWRSRVIHGMFLMLMIAVYGGICNNLKLPKRMVSTPVTKGFFILRIEETAKKTQTGYRYESTCFQLKSNSCKKISGAYFYVIGNNAPSLHEGDWILSSSPLKPIQKNNNPGAYDFASQSAMKGIFIKVTAKNTGEYIILYHEKNVFKESIAATRKWIIETLENNLPDKKIVGLAEAMIIGYRDDLDKDLLTSYVNTGVVHIIAISGLHLSLIFMIIDFFVRLFLGKKRTDIVGLFITIPILWSFALLTGSSASVIRSALMLTVVLIAKALNKKTNGLNALLASALILLIHNPQTLYDIGFQLSYIAVASILIFDPIIKKSVYVQNPILLKCWEMISITLSAQMLTTPITIFYFHQFPTLFLFTNLVAVPLSSIILISELLLCFTAVVHLPTLIPGAITMQLIGWLNQYIQKMEHIPFGMVKHIYIGTITLIFMYLFLIAVFYTMKKTNIKTIKFLALTFCLMSLIHLIDIINHKRKKRIAVLQVYGKTCILLQHGETGIIATNLDLKENRKTLQDITNQLGAAYWIRNFEFVSAPNKPFLLSVDVENLIGNKQKNPATLLVLSGTPRIQLIDLTLKNKKNLIIVADGSNKLWKIQQWEKEADRLLLHFNSLAKNGPIIIDQQ